MNLPLGLPDEIVDLVARWLVPLFLLFNIVGWAWLPQREVNRSNPRLTAQEVSELRRALWAAWLVGVVAALVALSGIFELFPALAKGTNPAVSHAATAGVIGACLGVARGILPRLRIFRDRQPVTQRRILAGLVMCAVMHLQYSTAIPPSHFGQ
jgi:hypothetical protein